MAQACNSKGVSKKGIDKDVERMDAPVGRTGCAASPTRVTRPRPQPSAGSASACRVNMPCSATARGSVSRMMSRKVSG